MKSLSGLGTQIAVGAIIALGLAGCASGGYYARGPIPPPPPNAYVRVPSPGVGYVWRPGYYNYAGRGYSWVGRDVGPPASGRSCVDESALAGTPLARWLLALSPRLTGPGPIA